MGLGARELALVSLGADICLQTFGSTFRRHVGDALDAGATCADIKEAALHMVIYASFPKTLVAMQELGAIFSALDQDGGHAMGGTLSVTAPVANLFRTPEVKAALLAIDHNFADLAMRMGSEVWDRPGLTQKERAYLCIAAHVCNDTLDLVAFHGICAGRRAPIPEAQLRALVAANARRINLARERCCSRCWRRYVLVTAGRVGGY